MKISREDKEVILDEYQNACDRTGPILACASCGVRDKISESEVEDMMYDLNALTYLVLSEEEMEERQEQKQRQPMRLQLKQLGRPEPVHAWKLRSVYEDERTGDCYHLHPELVDDAKSSSRAFICNGCAEYISAKECPPFSLKKGVDFGDPERLGLPIPNDLERHMIATVRLYLKVVKVNETKDSSATRKSVSGHGIAFNQDSPEVVANQLFFDMDRLKRCIKICLVGPDGELDRLAQRVLDNPNITGRGYVVHAWLSVLIAIGNHHYRHIPPLPSLSQMNEMCKEVNAHLIKSADRVTDEIIVDHDDALGDDMAKVRTADEGSSDEAQHNEAEKPVAHSFVSDSNCDNTPDLVNRRTLLGAAMACGIERDKSIRESNPLNEFLDNEDLLTGAFPDVFMFGRLTGTSDQKQSGSLNRKQRLHLLKQFTVRAATTPDLLFFLFNQQQRHEHIRGVNAKVKTNKKSFKLYQELLKSKDFKKKLNVAIKKPNSKEAKEVFKKISPVLKVSGRRAPFGAFQKSDVITKIYALG